MLLRLADVLRWAGCLSSCWCYLMVELSCWCHAGAAIAVSLPALEQCCVLLPTACWTVDPGAWSLMMDGTPKWMLIMLVAGKALGWLVDPFGRNPEAVFALKWIMHLKIWMKWDRTSLSTALESSFTGSGGILITKTLARLCREVYSGFRLAEAECCVISVANRPSLDWRDGAAHAGAAECGVDLDVQIGFRFPTANAVPMPVAGVADESGEVVSIPNLSP
ncbi:hypothetical protein Nepgr_018761 [Nepenthes gracilis]|uniref:Secreted protein n=1 Tax=Nepenthes gracilis TaxID=150966 RepID=A0AAD3XUK6_NEPGR|nr:hypothetical protein Nepgr_018761 [Nepenthes gracilis]